MMKNFTWAVVLCTLVLSTKAFALDDPASSQSDKSAETKKDGDTGLGDLFSGLAGQSLKVFMNPDLLKQIPGDNTAEKTENVKVLLGMIEGDTLAEKFEVIKALKKLQSDPRCLNLLMS